MGPSVPGQGECVPTGEEDGAEGVTLGGSLMRRVKGEKSWKEDESWESWLSEENFP